MTDNHSQSFFGQSTGITIQSPSKNENYIFIKCIKKKQNGSWEKPSLGEGKTIKISIEEMVMILKVLKGQLPSWTTYHKFNDNKTQISFKWENETKNSLWINIGEYPKMLGIPQVEIFKLLLKHLIKEKIEYSTVIDFSKIQANSEKIRTLEKKVVEIRPEKINMEKNTEKSTNANASDKIKISGAINGETEKALLLNFEGREFWVPKSKIHSKFNNVKGESQSFLIEDWILKKNKIVT
jgi:RNase P/RNase MRP subunit p29